MIPPSLRMEGKWPSESRTRQDPCKQPTEDLAVICVEQSLKVRQDRNY